MVDISQPRAPVAHTDGPEHRRQIANTVNGFIADANSKFSGLEQSIAANAALIQAINDAGIPLAGQLTSADDLDNIIAAEHGEVLLRWWSSGDQPANTPHGLAGFMIAVAALANRMTQLVFDRQSNDEFKRTWTGASWTAWEQTWPLTPPVLSQFFESAQQTITAGGALTIAHGLGTTPKLYTAVLVCATAQENYSPGDEVAFWLDESEDGASRDRGISIVPDAANLNVRYGNQSTTFQVLNKNTGVRASLTNANWRLVVRAWA